MGLYRDLILRSSQGSGEPPLSFQFQALWARRLGWEDRSETDPAQKQSPEGLSHGLGTAPAR